MPPLPAPRVVGTPVPQRGGQQQRASQAGYPRAQGQNTFYAQEQGRARVVQGLGEGCNPSAQNNKLPNLPGFEIRTPCDSSQGLVCVQGIVEGGGICLKRLAIPEKVDDSISF